MGDLLGEAVKAVESGDTDLADRLLQVIGTEIEVRRIAKGADLLGDLAYRELQRRRSSEEADSRPTQ